MADVKRLPEWLRGRCDARQEVHGIKRSLRAVGLHTVCEEARCPNIGECFQRKTATYLIMGDICTRRCGFCAVVSGKPEPLDSDEPRRVADHARSLDLRHVVITSVTRDDLTDGGAKHFVETICAVRAAIPKARVEVLTPDFEGNPASIELVCDACPDVFNHNIETVERLTPTVRNAARYRRSLDALRCARNRLVGGSIKSGFMLGLGERMDEVREALEDLKGVGCDFVTIGQYLPPSRNAFPVIDYIEPSVFEDLKMEAEEMGFKRVFAGPLVRSSYMADAMV